MTDSVHVGRLPPTLLLTFNFLAICHPKIMLRIIGFLGRWLALNVETATISQIDWWIDLVYYWKLRLCSLLRHKSYTITTWHQIFGSYELSVFVVVSAGLGHSTKVYFATFSELISCQLLFIMINLIFYNWLAKLWSFLTAFTSFVSRCINDGRILNFHIYFKLNITKY